MWLLLHRFLLWMWPAVFAGIIGIVGTASAVAQGFPESRPWIVARFDELRAVCAGMTGPGIFAGVAAAILLWLAAFVWSGRAAQPAVPKPTGLRGLKPMTRREQKADQALRQRFKQVSPEEGLRLVRAETEKLGEPRISGRYRALRRVDSWLGTHMADALEDANADREAQFGEVTRDVADRMIPFAALRDLAPKCGIPLPRYGKGQNNAYYMEEALGQAAIRGKLKAEGRPYRGPVRHNDFLRPIPPSHFEKFGFGHGVLGYDVANDKSQTEDIHMLTHGQRGIKDVTFYDLHVSERDALAVLHQLGKDPKIERP